MTLSASSRSRLFAAPRALALGILAAGAGCGTDVDGDFDGVAFVPAPTAFAVADRHDLVRSGGSYLAVRRADENMRLDLVLTGASVSPEEEWRRYPADRLLSLKKELATLDGVHVRGVPLTRVAAGEDVELRLDEQQGDGQGDFEVSLVAGLPPDEEVAEQGLGSDVNVKLLFDSAEITPRGGHVAGRLEIKRARAEGQNGEVATGEVTITFTAPIVPERLGKSNLSLLTPVMRCAAAAGPVRAGVCRDEPPLPYVDASGTLSGP